MDTSRHRVEERAKVDLDEIDPRGDTDVARRDARARLERLTDELGSLQIRLFAQRRHRLLVILQGPDTAGKDALVRLLYSAVNPQGVRLATFGPPSESESERDYLWRIHAEVPRVGELGLFNRSHYEDIIRARVDGLVPESTWRRRYQHIRQFEGLLTDEGTTVVKLFLHLSSEEQRRRLQDRMDDPEERWKFTLGDLADRRRWEARSRAYEDMLTETSTEAAPWWIVPSDRPWLRDLIAMRVVVEALRELDLRLPEPSDELDADLREAAEQAHALAAHDAPAGHGDPGEGPDSPIGHGDHPDASTGHDSGGYSEKATGGPGTSRRADTDPTDEIVIELPDAPAIPAGPREVAAAAIAGDETGLAPVRSRWTPPEPTTPATEGAFEAVRVAELAASVVDGSPTSQARLAHLATHDALTNLPNRSLLLDRLQLALAHSSRSRHPVAVLFMDLDRFKVINDRYGHAAGDSLLVDMAARLSDILRPSDTVARLGGDEFVVLCEDIEDETHAMSIAERVANALTEKPFRVADTDLAVTVSIGVAVSDEATDPDSLMRDADAAMYQAKEHGRARAELYDDTMRTNTANRAATAEQLDGAVSRGEFELHHQALFDTDTLRISAVEALVRWRHPTRGLLPAAEFVDVADAAGMISELDMLVLAKACEQAANWRAEMNGHAPRVHINISGRQIGSSELAHRIAAELEANSLPPDAICIEIAEKALMVDLDRSAKTLAGLRDLGVPIAVDDFGTSHSSLADIQRLAIGSVKLSSTLVSRIGDEEGRQLLDAIISFAHALDIEVIASGVESADQLAPLVDIGCDKIQGYVFHQPSAAHELTGALVAARSRRS
ncbi:MAG: EAL domain-containing protein [Acidimicrobiales bacterium]